VTGAQVDQTLTPTGWCVNLDNGHSGICFEWVSGLTMCGESFDPETVDREWYDGAPESRDEPHATQCFDCHNWSAAARDATRGQTDV
jgi:hypothetical protein